MASSPTSIGTGGDLVGLKKETLAIDTTGQWLYTLAPSNDTTQYKYQLSIDSSGQLTALAPPYLTGSGSLGSFRPSPLGSILYGFPDSSRGTLAYLFNQNMTSGLLSSSTTRDLNMTSMAAGFHPGGKWVYILGYTVGSSTSNLFQYSVDPSSNLLTPLNPASATVGTASGDSLDNLTIDPSGTWLYATTHGQAVYQFSISSSTGAVSAVGQAVNIGTSQKISAYTKFPLTKLLFF